MGRLDVEITKEKLVANFGNLSKFEHS